MSAGPSSHKYLSRVRPGRESWALTDLRWVVTLRMRPQLWSVLKPLQLCRILSRTVFYGVRHQVSRMLCSVRKCR
jgi:hypothetical protein